MEILKATPVRDKETSKEVEDSKRRLGMHKGLVGGRNSGRGNGIASECKIGKGEEDVAEDGIGGARGQRVTKIGDDAQFEGSAAGMGALKEVIVGLQGATGRTEGTRGGIGAVEVAATWKNAVDKLGCERRMFRRLT